MAISKTELINKALTLVGANPITNISDDTNNARIVNRVYEGALRSILAECRWNFATTRAVLVTSADSPDWLRTDESYVYARPHDIVRIFGTSDDDAQWREEGDYIISDTASLGIVYTTYIEDTSKFPAFFLDAFIDRLCVDIAYMIVNDKALAKEFQQRYSDESLPKAMSQNAQIGYQSYLKDDAWERAKDSDGSTLA